MRIGNITAAMIAQYEHPRIKIVTNGMTITDDDIVSGSFSYKGGCSTGSSFEAGGCASASVSFAVMNYSGSYTGAFADGQEVLVYVGYGASDSSATWDLLCTVYVSEYRYRRSIVTVQCLDGLRKGDKVKWTTYAFPMTVNEIITSAATEAGITVANLPTYGGTISVDLRDADGNQPALSLTCRQAIQQALQISGNWGQMNAAGNLSCGWYDWDTIDKVITADEYFDGEFSGGIAYTGVQVAGGTIQGTDTYLYTCSNSFVTEDNAADITSRLYDAIVGHTFMPGSVGIFADPRLEGGDIIQVNYEMGDGTTQINILPVTAYTFKGSIIENISCEASSSDSLDDLRETDTKKIENAATEEYVQEYVADHGGSVSGDYVPLDSALADCDDGAVSIKRGTTTTADHASVIAVYDAESYANATNALMIGKGGVTIGPKSGSSAARWTILPLSSDYGAVEGKTFRLRKTPSGTPSVLITRDGHIILGNSDSNGNGLQVVDGNVESTTKSTIFSLVVNTNKDGFKMYGSKGEFVGEITFDEDVYMLKDLHISGDLYVDGDVTITGHLTASGTQLA